VKMSKSPGSSGPGELVISLIENKKGSF